MSVRVVIFSFSTRSFSWAKSCYCCQLVILLILLVLMSWFCSSYSPRIEISPASITLKQCIIPTMLHNHLSQRKKLVRITVVYLHNSHKSNSWIFSIFLSIEIARMMLKINVWISLSFIKLHSANYLLHACLHQFIHS